MRMQVEPKSLEPEPACWKREWAAARWATARKVRDFIFALLEVMLVKMMVSEIVEVS